MITSHFNFESDIKKMLIAFLTSQINWANRLRYHNGSLGIITVDGTDFRVPRYGNHPKKYNSHKFKGKPGLRYEIAICIQSGDIVHINGPYPCGEKNDIQIFRLELKGKMRLGHELAEADLGYQGEPFYIELPDMHGGGGKMQKKAKADARSRHENCNKRFKEWAILNETYRHSEESHGKVFRAIAALIQIDLRSGNPLRSVEYRTILTPERSSNLKYIREKRRSRGLW